jgi:WD40-like Beta Propeller Repeat
MEKLMFKKIFLLLLILSIALSACGTLEVSMDSTPTPAVDANVVATIVAETLTAFPSATTLPVPTKPLSVCRLAPSSFPEITHFTPVDGKGAIAYSSNFLQDGLTLVFPDTGKVEPLHQLKMQSRKGADMGISWSPDGTKIAFLYAELGPGKSESYLMVADLLLGEVCAINQTLALHSNPLWSPDGKMIALADYSPAQLKVINLDDGSERNIANNVLEASFDSPLRWENSAYIAYIRTTEIESTGDLVKQPLDGSTPTLLLEKVFGLYSFSLSPDGKWLAYNSFDPAILSGRAILKNLQSGMEQTLEGEDLATFTGPLIATICLEMLTWGESGWLNLTYLFK